MTKQKIVAIVLIVLIVLQIGLLVFLCSKIRSKNTSVIDFVLVIDAGHGGIDGGVSVGGVKESDLNLQYAKNLGEIFSRCGFGVVYTRKTKDGLYGSATKGFKLRDMQKRKEIICQAQPSIVISIHMNKFSQSSRSGPQVFFQSGSTQSKALADSLQATFNAYTGNFHNAISGDYYICRESPCPAVIVECGFLSNKEELEKLQTEEYRNTVCRKIFDGVMMYLYSA